jgi:hypothetical protein
MIWIQNLNKVFSQKGIENDLTTKKNLCIVTIFSRLNLIVFLKLLLMFSSKKSYQQQ